MDDRNRQIGHCYAGLCAAMYLDPFTPDTGCLRVIPGSHLLPGPVLDLLAPMHSDIPANFSADGRIERFAISPNEVPGLAIESEPGDVIFFSHQLWHASFGGKPGRRLKSLRLTTDREREHIQTSQAKKQREAEAVGTLN